MNKKIKTKAKYEGGVLKPEEALNLSEGESFQIIILDTNDYDDVTAEDIMKLAENDPAFAFLNDPREDGYTLDDLKVRYK